jgi:resuscitation-promoting factor RpfB
MSRPAKLFDNLAHVSPLLIPLLAACAVIALAVASLFIGPQITINDNGTLRTVNTDAETVGAALHEAGATLYVADVITPDLGTPISAGMVITIQRSVEVTVELDGTALRTRSAAPTVGAALADLGIALIGLDAVEPGEMTPLSAGMIIRVIRR